MPEFDGVELQEWAERYGHPEDWAKRAQAAHARAERLAAKLEEIHTIAGRFMSRGLTDFSYEDINERLGVALGELSMIRRRAAAALSSTGPRPSAPQTTPDAAGLRAKEQHRDG